MPLSNSIPLSGFGSGCSAISIPIFFTNGASVLSCASFTPASKCHCYRVNKCIHFDSGLVVKGCPNTVTFPIAFVTRAWISTALPSQTLPWRVMASAL